jgi:hypothetical protein
MSSILFPKTLKMEQTSGPETLVMHQKTTPGNNPEDFKEHYDHGGSLQLHTVLNKTIRAMHLDPASYKFLHAPPHNNKHQDVPISG